MDPRKISELKIPLLSNGRRSRCSPDCLHASDQSILLWHFTFTTSKGSPSLIHPDQFRSCFDILCCPDRKGTSERACTISDGFACSDRFTSNELHTNVNPLNNSQSCNCNQCLELDSYKQWRFDLKKKKKRFCGKYVCIEMFVTHICIDSRSNLLVGAVFS